MRDGKLNGRIFKWALSLGPVVVGIVCCLIFLAAFTLVGESADEPAALSQSPSPARADQSVLTPEERIEVIEKTLQSVKSTGEKAEGRSYENKMMARELIRYVKIMTIILAAAAIGFPLTIWFLSRKRILGLSGLSGEVAATLLLVEERQAKLTNILKDIQGEVDYLHTMSVPDLKNLIEQAEKYLKQNAQDLEEAGLTKEKHK
ncbi:MAG TPA: hypothetical protein VK463_10325 [Desulfomonilaceae bacterium]|nr:hypothetical protein [Desulfomonilaceae bacterium]